MYPEITSPGKSVQALRELLAIGALPMPEKARMARAKERITNYRAEAEAFHREMDGVDCDLPFLVQTDVARLQTAVDREIAHRTSRRMDDAATQFLERITDYLDGQ